MKILKANNQNIKLIAESVLKGEISAIPTETVYGFMALAGSKDAVNKLFDIKKRPLSQPLALCVRDIDHLLASLENQVVISKSAMNFMEKCYLEPVTFVLPKSKQSTVSDVISANSNTIAVRVSQHSIFHKLSKIIDSQKSKVSKPIVLPSANIFSFLSPTRPEHISEIFDNNSDVKYLLDGGACDFGIESTIIDLTSDIPSVLRLGAFEVEKTFKEGEYSFNLDGSCKVAKDPTEKDSVDTRIPSYSIRLNATDLKKDERGLAFQGVPNGSDLDLSESGDLMESIHNLYDFLYRFERLGTKKLAIGPIPEKGLGLSIFNRLLRLAS